MNLKPIILFMSLIGVVYAASDPGEPSLVSPSNPRGFDLSTLFNEETMKALENTNAALYEAQQSGNFYAGRLRIESGGRTLHPVHVSIPRVSFNGGCEMIDIYGGGISFVNDPRYIKDLLQKIIQNSGTYAFNLALSEMSPVIKSTLDNIAEQAQLINQNQLDSCEIAQKFVDPLYAKIRGEANHKKALEGMGQNRNSSYIKEKNTVAQKTQINPKNITLEILKLSVPGAKSLTFNEFELGMNLMGTVCVGGTIVQKKTSQSEESIADTQEPATDSKGTDTKSEKKIEVSTIIIPALDFAMSNPRSLYIFGGEKVSDTFTGEKDIPREDFDLFIKKRELSFLSVDHINKVLNSYIQQLKADREPLDRLTKTEMENLLAISDFPVLAYLNASVSSNRSIGHDNIAKGIREALIIKMFENVLSVYEYNLSLIELDVLLQKEAVEILERARINYHNITNHRAINTSTLIEETLMMERLMADRVAKKMVAWQKNARGQK